MIDHKAFALSRVKRPVGSLVSLPAVSTFEAKQAPFTPAMHSYI